MTFDWHSSEITRETPVGPSYRNTQNVRRFMRQNCGEGFRFDRDFMAWVRGDTPKTMGDVIDHWLSTHPSSSDR